MQRTSKRDFLHNVGFGAISLPMLGNWSLVPLARFGTLPPVAAAPRHYDSVEEQANAMLKGYNVPGMAIGLIRDGRLVYARGFGVQSVDTRRPMTEYSIMEVASLSKTFTGAAILQLQEAGRLTLDDAYVKHVPYFKMVDPRYKDITLRHLLAHTAGFPEVPASEFLSEWEDPWLDEGAAERLVRSLDGGLMLRQDPGGSEYIYSGIGYQMLAVLIHDLTGELFEDYQRKHILDPLHMFKSTFLMSEVKPWDLAAAHIRDAAGTPIVWDHYPYTRQHAPDCCFFTNIVDMSHWVIANINHGSFFNRIMQPETQAQLWVPLYDNPWGWPGVGYNSGFWIMNYAESGIGPVRMILTVGGAAGIETHATIFPEQGLAAIVFVNLKATPHDPAYSWGICDDLAIQMLRGEL
jgi:CubicO group peptidase (beta-lactamase class C family)